MIILTHKKIFGARALANPSTKFPKIDKNRCFVEISVNFFDGLARTRAPKILFVSEKYHKEIFYKWFLLLKRKEKTRKFPQDF